MQNASKAHSAAATHRPTFAFLCETTGIPLTGRSRHSVLSQARSTQFETREGKEAGGASHNPAAAPAAFHFDRLWAFRPMLTELLSIAGMFCLCRGRRVPSLASVDVRMIPAPLW